MLLIKYNKIGILYKKRTINYINKIKYNNKQTRTYLLFIIKLYSDRYEDEIVYFEGLFSGLKLSTYVSSSYHLFLTTLMFWEVSPTKSACRKSCLTLIIIVI